MYVCMYVCMYVHHTLECTYWYTVRVCISFKSVTSLTISLPRAWYWYASISVMQRWQVVLEQLLLMMAVFSPRIIRGMTGGHSWGMAYGHNKAFDLFPFPHQRKICSEGLQGRHTLSMLGRTLDGRSRAAQKIAK